MEEAGRSFEQTRGDRPSWLTEGLILVAIPALAYYLTFSYERWYCDVFDIPQEFIKLDLTTVLVYAAAILGVWTIVLPVLDVFADLPTSPAVHPNAWGRLVKKYVPFFVFFAAVSYFYWDVRKFSIFTGLIILAMLSEILIARLFGDKTKPLAERINPQSPLLLPGSGLNIVKARLGAKLTGIILTVAVGTLLSGVLGASAALKQEAFLVPSSHPNRVVLRQYGDKLICAAVDFEKRIVIPDFIVLTLGADPNTRFELKPVGPLRLRQ